MLKYRRCTTRTVYIDIFIKCNLVDTRWQQYSTHLHTNSTQDNIKKQNTKNRAYITIRTHFLTVSTSNKNCTKLITFNYKYQTPTCFGIEVSSSTQPDTMHFQIFIWTSSLRITKTETNVRMQTAYRIQTDASLYLKQLSITQF